MWAEFRMAACESCVKITTRYDNKMQNLTREAMADYLGLTLETVSRQISALRKDGVIELEGKRHVTVPDMSRLLEEAGDDADGGVFA